MDRTPPCGPRSAPLPFIGFPEKQSTAGSRILALLLNHPTVVELAQSPATKRS